MSQNEARSQAPEPSPLPNVARVAESLRAAGIRSDIRELDERVHTAAASAEALGVELGAVANSLVFAADDSVILVMTSGAHRVDVGFLAEALGFRTIGRASAEQVRAATGQPIGGVAPTGHPAPVPTFVDRALRDHPVLWAGGGTPRALFPLTYAELLRLTSGREVEVTPP